MKQRQNTSNPEGARLATFLYRMCSPGGIIRLGLYMDPKTAQVRESSPLVLAGAQMLNQLFSGPELSPSSLPVSHNVRSTVNLSMIVL
jgi:hypothetical protein